MTENPFLKILKKYREQSFSEVNKGNRFERLMLNYLKTDTIHSHNIKSIWLWNDFPYKNQLGSVDLGIDIVAFTNEDEYWAVQCKCYSEDAIIDKHSVDSFLSTSSRTFTDNNSIKQNFSKRIWISTTNNWGKNADESIQNQNPPVTRINLDDLINAPVDWEKIENNVSGINARTPIKELRDHQKDALNDTNAYFKTKDRGKLIMACGTGKTLTSLRIAENETNGNGLVLFLVPSIALMAQSLKEWFADAKENLEAICICSDANVSKSKTKFEDETSFSIVDLAQPASTNVSNILKQFVNFEKIDKKRLLVVFSTYQSIDIISKAQKELEKINSKFSTFDLIICDEAHRTTGVSLADEDESHFVKVHNNDFLKSKKRLYMTATPRLYNDKSKEKAKEADAYLCSMDDESIYGTEIYRIGFGKAVEKDLLSDYKVLILAMKENTVPKAVQDALYNQREEINMDDISKLIGCINALSKNIIGDNGSLSQTDPEPMKRAVAFCSTIKVSEIINKIFNLTSKSYIESLPETEREKTQFIESRHIDGTMSITKRSEHLNWLKSEADNKNCRVLTNVKCLSEGVDVPSLDAVLFLSPKNSQVEVVQSVGRVMRKSPGKKYGYIIIPIVVGADEDPDLAIENNQKFKEVWTILNAIRAHDDRFNATINQIELNVKKPDNILVVTSKDNIGKDQKSKDAQENKDKLYLEFEKLQAILYGKMVKKVGDRLYWDIWAKDVADIATNQAARINDMITKNVVYKNEFSDFLKDLQQNINPSINKDAAIEMLAQHIITQPVFEALFKNYSFVKENPVSRSMEKLLSLFDDKKNKDELKTLEKFYESVKRRVEGIDNAKGKQKIINDLYDNFFKTAFPKMANMLGIVYTPVEVVDFIIHSVDDILKKEFDRNLTDKNVNILDPFTGTGTFISRLIQSGLIKAEDLNRKYESEIFCNEMVLLAYYIAAVNIENVYHDTAYTRGEYKSFPGICLTDTFQLYEHEEHIFSKLFKTNSARVEKQIKEPITVIMGNPPYSKGQTSVNDNAQNQEYKKLEKRIEETYVKYTKVNNKNAMYDSYFKAFRWSTDRLDKNGGVICYVSNGAWLDSNSADGFRKCLEEEFSSIYVFNLRGNTRTTGENARKEGGQIFGIGSRTPISITLLVKNPKVKNTKAYIYYKDIGDYLKRDEKLKIISEFKSFVNKKMDLTLLKPNEHGDWIDLRNEKFNEFIHLSPEKKYDINCKSFFLSHSLGVATGRDAWVYNFSKKELEKNIKTTINYFNEQRELVNSGKQIEVVRISSKGNFTRDWQNNVIKNLEIVEDKNEYRNALYRPFVKINNYFSNELNEERYQLIKIFPNKEVKNLVICVSGKGGNKDFSCIISDLVIDLNTLEAGVQCFPLYYYEKKNENNKDIFEENGEDGLIKRDGVSDYIKEEACKKYKSNISKEDIFFYVYGYLHNKEYRETFANDLKKMLPRLPLVDDIDQFLKYSRMGRELADIHVNYESVEPLPEVKVTGDDGKSYEVIKMRFPKKDQKDAIIYNNKITITNIPLKAYEYVINGKSAIEWIMERYQITTHKDSGLINNPNHWAAEHNKPRYILDLLLSVISLSVRTVEIVKSEE